MTELPFRLQLELLLLVSCFILFIYRYVHKRKISVRYSVVWFVSAFMMMICTIFPKGLNFVASLLGIETVSNLIFLGGFLILFIIAFSLTIIVSDLKQKVMVLTQELGMIKKELEEGKQYEKNSWPITKK